MNPAPAWVRSIHASLIIILYEKPFRVLTWIPPWATISDQIQLGHLCYNMLLGTVSKYFTLIVGGISVKWDENFPWPCIWTVNWDKCSAWRVLISAVEMHLLQYFLSICSKYVSHSGELSCYIPAIYSRTCYTPASWDCWLSYPGTYKHIGPNRCIRQYALQTATWLRKKSTIQELFLFTSILRKRTIFAV